MASRRLVHAALLASTTLLASLVARQTLQASADRMTRRSEPARGVHVEEQLIDASPTFSRTSVEVLAERLEMLGLSSDEAASLIGELDAWKASELEADAGALKTRIAALGLPEAKSGKALVVCLAYLAGHPVGLAGAEIDDRLAAAIQGAMASGLDADEALWHVGRHPLPVLTDLPIAPSEPVAQPKIATCKTCPQVDHAISPTSVNQFHTSSIEGSGCAIYRFTALANRVYQFSLCAADGGSAAFDSLIQSYGSSCISGTTADDTCGDDAQLQLTTTSVGYRYIRVSSLAGSGAYTLSYRDLGAACKVCPAFDLAPPAPTTQWQFVSGSFDEFQCRVYRFTVGLNKVYQFTTCSPGSADFDTVIETHPGNCSVGPSNDDSCQGGGSTVLVSSSYAGHAYVRVRGVGAESGTFTLAYRDAADTCLTCPLFHQTLSVPTYDFRTASGTMPPASCKTYRVTLTAGRTYLFSTCQYGGATAFTETLELYNPSCGYVAGDANCAEFTYTPVTTGYHYLTLGDASGTGGPFTIAYGLFAAPCPYREGLLVPTTTPQQVSAEIERSGQVRRHGIAFTAYRPYEISICSAALGGSAPPSFTAQLLHSNCVAFNFEAPSSGSCTPATTRGAPSQTITGMVEINGGGATGPYTLGYKEIPCTQWWESGITTEPASGMGTLYNPDTLQAGTFRTYRFTGLNGTRTYTFSLCTAAGASAAFNGRLEAYSGTNCAAMALTRTVCGDDEQIVVPAAGNTSLFLRIIAEDNLGGAFRVHAKR